MKRSLYGLMIMGALAMTALVTPAAAEDPHFLFKVDVDVQDLKAKVGGIVVICDVYQNDFFHEIGRNTKTVRLDGDKGAKSYRGIVEVPVSVRPPLRQDAATHYRCELQMFGDANWTKPVPQPAPAIWDWKTARADRPFVPILEGRIPGR